MKLKFKLFLLSQELKILLWLSTVIEHYKAGGLQRLFQVVKKQIGQKIFFPVLNYLENFFDIWIYGDRNNPKEIKSQVLIGYRIIQKCYWIDEYRRYSKNRRKKKIFKPKDEISDLQSELKYLDEFLKLKEFI